MNKSYGATQFAWESLKEDQRLSWKIFSRGVAILASFFVTKTGNTYFDWTLTIITAFFLLTIIETQRAYTKLSPRYRKLFIRIAITLGSWGIAILGAAWFSQASLVAMAKTFSNSVMPQISHSTNISAQIFISMACLLTLPIATIRAYRQMNVEKVIYHLPKNGLKQLFIYKKFKATSFTIFACFELSTLLICFIYACSVANVGRVLIDIVTII